MSTSSIVYICINCIVYICHDDLYELDDMLNVRSGVKTLFDYTCIIIKKISLNHCVRTHTSFPSTSRWRDIEIEIWRYSRRSCPHIFCLPCLWFYILHACDMKMQWWQREWRWRLSNDVNETLNACVIRISDRLSARMTRTISVTCSYSIPA